MWVWQNRAVARPLRFGAGLSGIARTSSDLAASTVVTSLLGLVFWSLAARMYSPEAVGLGNAQISAASLVATAAQLNLGVMLTRYVPAAGRHSPWIVRRVYSVVLVLSILGAAAFLLLGFQPGSTSWQSTALFVLAVPCFAVFAIQDMALVSLGASRIVPLENLIFSAVKAALLIPVAGMAVVSGVFLAWVIPAMIAVAVVTYLIANRFLPAHVSGSSESVSLPRRALLWRLLAWQYIAGLANQAYKSGLPLVISAVLGLAANGYFTVPWTVFLSFATLIANVQISFQYHTRRGDPVTPKVFRGVLTILGLMAGVGSIVVVVGAPIILRIVAPAFAAESTTLLRLLGAAVPPLAVWTFFLAFVWLENRFVTLAVCNVIVATCLIGLSIVACQAVGANGAGFVVLGTFSVCAIFASVGLWRRWRLIEAGSGNWATND